MIICDSYPVQNYGQGIKCPRRGMGYEGVDCMIDWSCVCSYLDELDRNKGRNVHDESDAGTRNTFAGCPFPHREEYLEDCRLGGASLKCTVYCIMQHACNG